MDRVHYNGQTYDQLAHYIKEDHVPSDNLWFATFTICPKSNKYQAITQYEMTVNEIRQILDTWTCRYTLSTELTDQGNVHYHAILNIKDKLQKFRIIESCKKKRVLGFCKINNTPIHTGDMLNKSCNYIIKDLDKTREIIRRGGYRPDLLYIKNI